jgi:hypothetical protein
VPIPEFWSVVFYVELGICKKLVVHRRQHLLPPSMANSHIDIMF